MPPCWIIRSAWFKTAGHPVTTIVRHRAIYIIVAEIPYSPRIFIVRATIHFCRRHERDYPNLLPTMPVYHVPDDRSSFYRASFHTICLFFRDKVQIRSICFSSLFFSTVLETLHRLILRSRLKLRDKTCQRMNHFSPYRGIGILRILNIGY